MILAAWVAASMCGSLVGFEPVALVLLPLFLVPLVAPIVIAIIASIGSTLGQALGRKGVALVLASAALASPFGIPSHLVPGAAYALYFIPVFVALTAASIVLMRFTIISLKKEQQSGSWHHLTYTWLAALAFYGLVVFSHLSSAGKSVPMFS